MGGQSDVGAVAFLAAWRLARRSPAAAHRAARTPPAGPLRRRPHPSHIVREPPELTGSRYGVGQGGGIDHMRGAGRHADVTPGAALREDVRDHAAGAQAGTKLRCPLRSRPDLVQSSRQQARSADVGSSRTMRHSHAEFRYADDGASRTRRIDPAPRYKRVTTVAGEAIAVAALILVGVLQQRFPPGDLRQ